MMQLTAAVAAVDPCSAVWQGAQPQQHTQAPPNTCVARPHLDCCHTALTPVVLVGDWSCVIECAAAAPRLVAVDSSDPCHPTTLSPCRL